MAYKHISDNDRSRVVTHSSLVHGSHLKQKKFTDTKSLGITRPYLVRQPVNTPRIGWYMLLEHQVIWCQGEAAGPNHGARKAYTNRLSTWFAPKI